MNKFLNLLGPTATESEHKLLSVESGNMEVTRMKENLEKFIEQRYTQKDYDTKRLSALQEFEATAFNILQERGVKLDIDIFNRRMEEVIDQHQQNGQTEEAMQQQQRMKAINARHTRTQVIHPTVSTSRSRTGRITVSNPAIQSWKSSVRTAILPPDEDYGTMYSMDFKAYDPTVLAVLSRDRQLEADLQTEDFYSHLLHEIGHTSDQEHKREAMKQIFLTCFINGGNAEYHLQKHNLTLTANDWKKVLTRYSVAHKYIATINQTGNAESLNGITYQFKPDDNAKFSKFIQHEAAFIFRNVFAEVLKTETNLDVMALLPVHDEIMIAVKEVETAAVIQNLMTETFREVTSSPLAQVTANQLGGEENA